MCLCLYYFWLTSITFGIMELKTVTSVIKPPVTVQEKLTRQENSCVINEGEIISSQKAFCIIFMFCICVYIYTYMYFFPSLFKIKITE